MAACCLRLLQLLVERSCRELTEPSLSSEEEEREECERARKTLGLVKVPAACGITLCPSILPSAPLLVLFVKKTCPCSRVCYSVDLVMQCVYVHVHIHQCMSSICTYSSTCTCTCRC